MRLSFFALPLCCLSACALVLVGCATDAPPPAPAPIIPLGGIKIVCTSAEPMDWNAKQDDDKALNDALKPLPDDSVIIRMAIGWRSMFDQANACQKAANIPQPAPPPLRGNLY